MVPPLQVRGDVADLLSEIRHLVSARELLRKTRSHLEVWRNLHAFLQRAAVATHDLAWRHDDRQVVHRMVALQLSDVSASLSYRRIIVRSEEGAERRHDFGFGRNEDLGALGCCGRASSPPPKPRPLADVVDHGTMVVLGPIPARGATQARACRSPLRFEALSRATWLKPASVDASLMRDS